MRVHYQIITLVIATGEEDPMSSDDDRTQLQALLAEDRPLRELGAEYERGRARIDRLVAALDGGAADAPVPACPEWSIRDVLAHLTGICSDVLAGNIAGAATDAWTSAQVDSRKGRTVAELLTEWDEVGPRFATLLDDFPGRICLQPVADITVHEHDIRGALGRPGAQDSEGVAIGIEFLVDVFLLPGAAALGLGPLEVHVGDRRFIAGSGGAATGDLETAWQSALRSSDDVDADVPAASPVGALTVEPFELFRALTGRRSEAQIRSFEWTVDPEPYLPIFGTGPFTIRPTDLIE
jgi:uncharacterized protein (TIGR03083 family)